MEKNISTGLKVWLWFVIVVNAIGAIDNLLSIGDSTLSSIFSILVEALLIYGAVLIMFKTKKLGFQLICVAAAVNAVVSVIFTIFAGLIAGAAAGSVAVGIAGGLFGVVFVIIFAILNPLITYLLMKKDWDMFE